MKPVNYFRPFGFMWNYYHGENWKLVMQPTYLESSSPQILLQIHDFY